MNAEFARMLANFGGFPKLSAGVDGLPWGAGRSIRRNEGPLKICAHEPMSRPS